MIAGAFVAALFAIGSAPALAQPDFSITKTGTLDGGDVVFTISVENTGDDSFAHVADLLPLFPGSDWSIDSDVDMGCGSVVGAPGTQQSLECDPNLTAPVLTATVVVRSPAPDGGCEVVTNTATIALTDTSPIADSATASVSTGGTDCRMTGGGSIFTDGKGSVRVTHGFELRCDIADHRQNLEINWPGTGKGQNNFHLTSLTDADCFFDPAIGPPNPPKSGFNTFVGAGVGTCNGQPAVIRFIFTDAGEPGTKDTAGYQIAGACVLGTDETNLTKGNQQAHSN
jgi:hypothetical protein